MERIEQQPTKEALPGISIERYMPEDRESIVAGIADISEIERSLSDTRRPGTEIAEGYFEHVSKEVAEKSGAIFVARSEGKVAGFVACWIEHDDDLIKTEEANTYGYISDAWVAPALRDRGLFGELNAQVEAYMSGFPDVHFIRMNVIAGNERAQAAYTKMGYGPEEITMAKRIRSAATD